MSPARSVAIACLALTVVGPRTTVAQPCAPPPGFMLSAAPSVNSDEHRRLARTIVDTIDVPLSVFQAWFDRAPLSELLRGTREIPAVAGTRQLGALAFPAIGATRYVCLADGNAAVERVLAVEPQRRFEYVVWGYTLPEARPLRYGHGSFAFAALDSSTIVRWTYSFALDKRRLPGRLGPVGRWLFSTTFLDRTYVPFMQAGMRAIRSGAEQAYGRP